MIQKQRRRLGAALVLALAILAACGKTPTPAPGATSGPTAAGTRAAAVTPTGEVPSVISFLPSCGKSAHEEEATFTGVFEDPDGADNIKVAWLLFNTNPILPGGVSVAYNRDLDSAVIFTDTASNWSRSQEGGLGVGEDMSNDRVEWRVKQSSAALDGDRLTVTWVLAFKSGFPAQSYNVFMMATDKGGNSSGWQQVGTWGVAADPNPPCASR